MGTIPIFEKTSSTLTAFPAAFIQQIESQYPDSYQNLLDALNNQAAAALRYHPIKTCNHFEHESAIPWYVNGVVLTERPSFILDPRWHAGAYYVQEASSMFVAHAFEHAVGSNPNSIKVLDACAAPGGKSTLIQSLLKPNDVLVSNEIIKNRTALLVENIQKWGYMNAFVTNNDPAELGKLNHYFDAILVDAPCSGEGMFRKDKQAVNEWSKSNVELCSRRQKRILADVLPSLKPGGILIYSTCTFNTLENEEQILALLNEGYESVFIPVPESWNIEHVTQHNGKPLHAYRFLPHRVNGEGLFIAVLKKPADELHEYYHKANVPVMHKDLRASLQQWLNDDAFFVQRNDLLFALNPEHAYHYSLLSSKLKLVYSGVEMGSWINNQLIPSHALALSISLIKQFPVTSLSFEDAIKYLRKDVLNRNVFEQDGWQCVAYEGLPLGWVKVLSNRVNNYFPTALRVLKNLE